MCNNDSIYSRLLAGESMDAIMTEFTNAANEAQKRYDEELAAREAEAAAKRAKETARRNDLADIIEDGLYYLAKYFPSFGITTEELDNMSEKSLNAMADLALMLLDLEAVNPTKKSFKTKSYKLPIELELNNKETFELKDKPLSADEVFVKAFKMFGL